MWGTAGLLIVGVPAGVNAVKRDSTHSGGRLWSAILFAVRVLHNACRDQLAALARPPAKRQRGRVRTAVFDSIAACLVLSKEGAITLGGFYLDCKFSRCLKASGLTRDADPPRSAPPATAEFG